MVRYNVMFAFRHFSELRSIRRLLGLSAVTTVLAGWAALGGDWAQFRGPDGTAVSPETNLPAEWSADSGLLWRVPLPGRANSSPAVTARRIDLTSQTDDQSLWVISLDRESGALRHKINVGRGELAHTGPNELIVHRHNAATPSPCADEDFTWAYFGTGLLVCVDAQDGVIAWKRDLAKEHGAYDISYGMASSPRLWKHLLFLNCLTRGPSYVLALDKATGNTVWKVERKFDVPVDHQDAYSTPTICEQQGKAELLVSGAGHVNAYDPLTGKELWSIENPALTDAVGRVIASPTCGDKAILSCCPNPTGAGKGRIIGIVNRKAAWEYSRATPDSSTPVVVNGLVYLVTDMGLASCLEEPTGHLVWEKRLGGGPYHASVVAGDNKVYFLGIDGVCTVIEQGREGKILARSVLPGTFYATPAISGGTMYLRAYEALYAVRTR